jgi:hypothetical protein
MHYLKTKEDLNIRLIKVFDLNEAVELLNYYIIRFTIVYKLKSFFVNPLCNYWAWYFSILSVIHR